ITGAMQLLPREGDFRSNFSLNQQAFEINLTDEMKRIAVKAARTLSLEIAGVDLLIDIQGRVFVLEVNYSPGFKGLEATTGLNIAEKIIDYAISLKTNLKNHEN
ncbi:MAG: 30S ribosomal protein S6--L-glutamate ligase, partial [Deltaproteobacteria bacterium]|nr:30S ribosomal protein S6--L-glutamate ligase [Deltaproteobacteria bacterium]